MMCKVIKAESFVHTTMNNRNSATLKLGWRCTLECGHVTDRVRSEAPSRLKCKICKL